MMEQMQLVAEHWPWFFPAAVFIFGTCVGSFLNVCIYRLPEGRSIVRPGSRCACGARIRPWDNIPVLSWFILRGRARCCGARFSIRYPFVEALTGGLYLWAFWAYPLPAAAGAWILIALLIACTFIDLDHMILPDVLTIGGALAGLIFSAAFPELLLGENAGQSALSWHLSGALTSLKGMLAGSGLVLWIREIAAFVFKREAMGFGDVLFLGAIGAFCGWQGAVFALFGGSVLGCALLFPVLGFKFLRAKLGGKGGANLRQIEVPFGPYLALGAGVYLLLLRAQTDAYFARFAELLTF